ncbi:thioredoxin family protein [Thermocrinis sp.]
MFEELTDKDIYDRAISAEKPAVVVFYKPGKGENQEVFNLLSKFQLIYGDKVNFFSMNAEQNTTHEDLGIFYFPTVLYFRETMELERHDYIPTEEEVERAIRRLLRL